MGLIKTWLAFHLRGEGSQPAHIIHAAITREVHETLRPGADSKNLQVVLDLPADLPLVIAA